MSHTKHSRPTLCGSLRDLLVSSGPGRSTKDHKENEKFYVQGETADSVFFIQHGLVKVTVTSEQGKVAVVGILLEGQFFGEGCLHGQARRTATSIALGDCRITSITKAAMLSAIRDQPEFGSLFMDHLLSRNGRIEEDVVDPLFNSSEKRLARLLLLLANDGKENNPPIVAVTISQMTVAEMIGTTRSNGVHQTPARSADAPVGYMSKTRQEPVGTLAK